VLIDKPKEKGNCGNSRNGVGERNKKRENYIKAAIKLFGTTSIILYFLYLCNIV